MANVFVGRRRDLAVLAEARVRALDGRRQLVVVTGAAGIGKTWFCEQAAEFANRDGFEVVWGRCWPHGGAPALWPWPAMLPALVGEAGTRLLEADSEQVGVQPERFARFAALARLLTESRCRTPTMIVIDDVQHADQSVLLLTRFLASTLDRLPLVVVLARRPSPAAGGDRAEALLAELQRDATTIVLRPFNLDDTTALLAAHGQSGPDLETAGTLLRVTAGSPLYLARAIERGWSGSGAPEHAIAEAIERLPPVHGRVLALAALLGPKRAAPEVASLAGTTPATILEALTAAADAGLVELTTDGLRLHDLVGQVATSRSTPPTCSMPTLGRPRSCRRPARSSG